MKAEILATRDAAGAMAIVNRIRTRAGADAELTTLTTDEALAFVKRERRVELMAEGVRWFDLVRWNEWQKMVVAKFARYANPEGTNAANVRTGRYLLPIPLRQMDAAPGLFTQNEGY